MKSIKKYNRPNHLTSKFKQTAEKLCELCNLIAMIFLQKDKYDACLEFLKKGEILSQKSKTFKALTYNNLACFYRRTGKLRIALKYLEKALAIEVAPYGPRVNAWPVFQKQDFVRRLQRRFRLGDFFFGVAIRPHHDVQTERRQGWENEQRFSVRESRSTAQE